MSYVQLDDLVCPYCNKITMGELNVKTGEYTCFKCGRVVNKLIDKEVNKHGNR